MSETTDGGSDDKNAVMRLWRMIGELTAGLPDAARRAVYGAIAIGVADGWRPSRTEVTDLVAFASQQEAAGYPCP